MKSLGKGTGYRFEIRNSHNKLPPLSEITRLGDMKKCWHPTNSETTYGKVGPISAELPMADIANSIETLEIEREIIS